MPSALVTGAGTRLGHAVATAFARAGYDLVAHAHRSVHGLAELAREVAPMGRKLHAVAADLSTEAGVAELAAAARTVLESLDVLVNNAGIYERASFAEVTREHYRRMLAVNLDAPFFLTQQVLPLLHAASSPCVINLTDIGAERVAPGAAHYAASKGGLLTLTRALAVELAPRVRVNAIAPGAVAIWTGASPEERQAILARVPMGREGDPNDIARAALFLARDAPYVTGHVLAIDGGWGAQL